MTDSSITPNAGKPGSGVQKSSALSLAQAMAGGDPNVTTDALMRSLTPSISSSLQPQFTTTYTEKYGADVKLQSYTLAKKVDREELSICLALAREAMVPASLTENLQLLKKMLMLTRPRSQGESDIATMSGMYSEKLIRYPADIVRAVVGVWPELNEFWPTWADLASSLELHVQRRRALLRVLESAEVQAN